MILWSPAIPIYENSVGSEGQPAHFPLLALVLRSDGRPRRFAKSRISVEEPPKTAKIGGASRDRTDDLIVANDALSQLSYSPARWRVYFFDFTSRSAISPRQLMLKTGAPRTV